MAARNIFFYGPHFRVFYDLQTDRVQQKIDYVLSLIAGVERIPEKFLKHIEGTKGLYEVRVRAGGEAMRIFGFFEEGGSLILLNAFKKTSEKIPGREMSLAQKLRRGYLAEKR